MTPTPIPESELRDATARVALAAVLHDSGKFAKRAGFGENREPGAEGKALHSSASVNGKAAPSLSHCTDLRRD